jgi:rhodanese-related sulfurtransferase
MATSGDDDIEVTVQQAAELQRDGAQIVDVREDHEVQAGHIPGVTHIPLGDLAEQASTLDPDKPIVFACKTGGRSMMAAQAFRASGIPAHSLAGGTEAWHAAGEPLEPRDGHVADH